MKIPTTIDQIIIEHSERLQCFHCGTQEEKIAHILRDYHDRATGSLENQKVFNDDLATFLRAIALVLDMTANASTHGEKNARLRGALELLESAIDKLRHHRFNFSLSHRAFSTDIFRSDYPTRHLLDRIRELESKLEAAKGRTTPATAFNASDDLVP